MKPKKTKPKQRNKKIVRDGKEFDSISEWQRWQELSRLEKAGIISHLRCQVEFELIPAQYEEVPTGELYKIGKLKETPKMKRVCVEKSVKYIADYVYDRDGETVVEDVKGYRDPKGATYAKYTIKRKLMLWVHGIKIQEIIKR
jgi:hypothetical protein